MTTFRLLIVFFTTLLILAVSCSTDVELNAPYKNTAVVFALLDPDPNGDNLSNSLDTQWVDIDRTFMGKGDNNVYAGIFDSVEYKNEDFVKRVVQKLAKGSSEPIEEYPLLEKIVPRASGGVFPAENLVYYFLPPANGLSHEHDYRLLLQFTDGREVSATTDMIKMANNNFWVLPNGGSMIKLANWNTTVDDATYISTRVQFYPPVNSISYDVSIRFNYVEKTYDTPDLQGPPSRVESKWFNYPIGYVERESTNGVQDISVEFLTEGFYTALSNTLAERGDVCRQIGTYFDPPGEEGARTTCFEVQVAMSNTILKDYINSNSLNISVAQERPIYTNINNGIGIFASRSTIVLKDLPLTPDSGDEGNLKSFTRSTKLDQFRFCDPNPTSDYPCTCGN
jgi:hypothetical protein